MEKRPRRPLTPFFIYREQEKDNGNSMGSADAGERWRTMTEKEKAPYIEKYRKAREKYDEYLISKGLPAKNSSTRKGKPPRYYPSRMKTLCSKLEAEEGVYRGLSRAAERFVLELSETVANEMMADNRRVISVEVIARVLEQPKFDFLNSMKEYDSIAAEAEKAVQDESEKRSQKRKKSDAEDTKKRGKGKNKKSKKQKKAKESESEESS
eukprot:TRINITY_DN1758_c0_g2_i1.p1 TRINITY_DN1758_c0_g2~~TRINITY_DN1758_c0_g2_i1.p1  ORF type:complete len:210 (+),score=73.81 TRINITY_DN1758_c0_g2_i1:112-741(+)